MRLYLIVLLFLMAAFALTAEGALIREIFYTPDKSEIIGYKEYVYNDSGNVEKVLSLDEDGNPVSMLIYTYEDNRIVRHDEFSNRMRVKSAYYQYDNSGHLTMIDEKDVNSRKIMSRHFYYNQDGEIEKIEDRTSEGILYGYKLFVYEKGLVSLETIYTDRKQIQFKKIYRIEKKSIRSYIIQTASGTEVRLVEREYSGKPAETNAFGWIKNFYDFR